MQIFLDLGERYLISGQGLKRGAMLGRGAFGFVYRATVNLNGNPNSEVAVKMLEPIDPGTEARISTLQIYKVILFIAFIFILENKWPGGRVVSAANWQA